MAVKILTKSSAESSLSSTRIGNRPCNSGIRSLGWATVKAPAPIKSTWSVATAPSRVLTTVPSTIGSRSRWTPSPETSGPLPSWPAILSISSINTMPSSWARRKASALTSSLSIKDSASWPRKISRPSRTLTRRRTRCLGMNPSRNSPSPAGASPLMAAKGSEISSWTSISTVSSSCLPDLISAEDSLSSWAKRSLALSPARSETVAVFSCSTS